MWLHSWTFFSMFFIIVSGCLDHGQIWSEPVSCPQMSHEQKVIFSFSLSSTWVSWSHDPTKLLQETPNFWVCSFVFVHYNQKDRNKARIWTHSTHRFCQTVECYRYKVRKQKHNLQFAKNTLTLYCSGITLKWVVVVQNCIRTLLKLHVPTMDLVPFLLTSSTSPLYITSPTLLDVLLLFLWSISELNLGIILDTSPLLVTNLFPPPFG